MFDMGWFLCYNVVIVNVKYNLNMTYEPIQKLMKLFKQYIDEDCDIKVSIPFPEINRTIKGKLATNVKEEVTVALINEKY